MSNSDIPAQKELTESSEELYYPILDRIHDRYMKIHRGLYKKKIEQFDAKDDNLTLVQQYYLSDQMGE